MRTDVKTLIAALTTERDSIDRAISGLKALSPAAQADATPNAVKHTRRTRMRISDETKREIVAAMITSTNKAQTARKWAKVTGAQVSTIAMCWNTWRRSLLGNAPAEIMDPATNGNGNGQCAPEQAIA